MPPEQQETVKTRKPRVIKMRSSTIWHLGINLEDGNADKEAEKLIPSPNFYVLMVCSKDFRVGEKIL
jgi:hypothetical protein